MEGEIAFLRGRACRSFFQNGMGICATYAKRVDPGPARPAVRGPGRQAVIDLEGGAVKINGRIRRLIAQRGRDLLMLQSQRGFHQPGDAGGGVQVTDIGFDRANAAIAFGLGTVAKGLGQGRDLDRISQIGAGAVAFHVINCFG